MLIMRDFGETGKSGDCNLKLAIVNLTGGGLSGGYLKYVRQMVPLLKNDPRVQALHVLNLRSAAWPVVSEVETSEWLQQHAWVGYRRLRGLLRQLAPDIVFIPTARWFDCNSIPTVVMIRNMEPLTIPFGGNGSRDCLKNLARAYLARTACRRANRVVAVSNHVRDFLIDEWKISPEKIGLVYHGVESPPDRAAMEKPKPLEGRDVGWFIFTAGSIRPARGLEDVIRAMAVTVSKEPALTLVIAGRSDPGAEFYRRRMGRLAEKLGIGTQVMWTGHLSRLEMAWCFEHCAAFVMSSRAEACPNTGLEAMSHGCQIISTAQPPMPEFFKEAALYYRPGDPGSLAEKIGTALAFSSDERRMYQLGAQARAKDFNWSDTAKKTIDELLLAMKYEAVPTS